MFQKIEPRDVTATIRPEDYVTEFDKMPSSDPKYRERQYNEALALAQQKDAIIYISLTSSWSASYTNERGNTVDVVAYERLGYHRDTDALVRGWLDGGAKILDYRPA